MSKVLSKELIRLEEQKILEPLDELLETITHLLRNSLNVSFANLTDLKESLDEENLILVEDSINSLSRIIDLVKSLESFLELKIVDQTIEINSLNSEVLENNSANKVIRFLKEVFESIYTTNNNFDANINSQTKVIVELSGNIVLEKIIDCEESLIKDFLNDKLVVAKELGDILKLKILKVLLKQLSLAGLTIKTSDKISS